VLTTNRDMPPAGSWARYSVTVYHEGGRHVLRIYGYAATEQTGSMQIDNVELVGAETCPVDYPEDEGICLEDPIGLSGQGGAFTIDFDLPPTTQAGVLAVLSQRAACISNEGSGANGWWSVRVSNGRLQFESWTTDAGYRLTSGVTPVNDGAWHRVRIVRDAAGQLSLFLDERCAADVTASHPGTFGTMAQPIGLDGCIGEDGTVALSSPVSWYCVSAP